MKYGSGDKSRSKKDKGKRYDLLVDWLFARMVDVLSSPTINISVVFKKINKGDYKSLVMNKGVDLALCCPDGRNRWMIKIEKRASEKSYARTFFHEVCHIFFDQFFFNNECSIEDIENILWPLLSTGQKQVIKELMYRLNK